MSAITIKNLLKSIHRYKDACFIKGNIGDILHLRRIEEKLEQELKAIE
jgi:hypothetical protein